MGNDQAKSAKIKIKNNYSNSKSKSKSKKHVYTPPAKTGFNCNYSHSRSLSPTTYHEDAAEFIETLKSYGSNEFDQVLDEVSSEVDPHYITNEKQSNNHQKVKVSNIQIKNNKSDSKKQKNNNQKNNNHGVKKNNNNKPKSIALKARLSNKKSNKKKNKNIVPVPFEIQSLIPPQNIVSNISTLFHYNRQLGKGASSRVLKAKCLKNDKVYAVKELIKSDEKNAESFRKEVYLLRKLIHPNILHFHDCYMDDNCFYIATEYCSGGTLLDRVIKQHAQSFSEAKASEYIRIILSAVNYMHSLSIVHRDLKAQNVVFDTKGNDATLQLIDFGDSKVVEDDVIYNEFVGTIHFVPPEVVRPRTGRELKKSDLWSIGVIAYVLVCGRPPFNGKTHQEIYHNIANKEISYPRKSQLTASCKDFIQGLLCKDINKRMSAQEALKHPWINGSASTSEHLSANFLQSLKRYNYDNKLQNILVNAILSEIEREEQEILNQGILRMNRQRAKMDSNNVVDYLLLHSNVADLPQDRKRFDRKLNFCMDYSAFSTILPSPIPPSPMTPDGTSGFDDDLDWDCLGGLDVDDILDEVDKKEKELELNIAKSNSSKKYVKHNLPESNVSSPNYNKQMVSYSMGMLEDADTEDDEEVEEYQYGHRMSRLSSIVNEYTPKSDANGPEYFSMEKSRSRSISVGKFRAIMDKSDKKYDVENIINDLNDGFGQISLDGIATYHKRVDTMEDINEIFDEMNAEDSKTEDNYEENVSFQ